MSTNYQFPGSWREASRPRHHHMALRSESRQSDELARERLAERTRIARELHDTLLQGFQAASMHMEVAVSQLPDDLAAKGRFSGIAEMMRRVIEQGRLTVQGLRATGEQDRSLANALATIPTELGLSPAVRFQVIVQGNSVRLPPSKWEDVYRICREAIVNAYRHSGADEIETALEYRRAGLRIKVRDNGCGIDSGELLEQNRHWGLQGMRERAERIGARLCIMSRHRLGTEVELFVPAAG